MRRARWLDFAERVKQQAGDLIPAVVYLPATLRPNTSRMGIDQITLTTEAPSIKENHLRIAAADPIGALIAVANGQPQPQWKITEDGKTVELGIYVPTFAEQQDARRWLAGRVSIRTRDKHNLAGGDEPDSWDALVAARNAKSDANNGI